MTKTEGFEALPHNSLYFAYQRDGSRVDKKLFPSIISYFIPDIQRFFFFPLFQGKATSVSQIKCYPQSWHFFLEK